MQVALFTKTIVVKKAFNAIQQSGNETVMICVDQPEAAPDYLPLYNRREIQKAKSTNKIDLLVSVMFPHRISGATLTWPRIGAVNFHPAPLPEYRGFAPYSFGIINQEAEWGVTAHHMTEEIDDGNIIRCDRFPINSETATAAELRTTSHNKVFQMVIELLEDWKRRNELPAGQPHTGGVYYSKADFERARRIDLSLGDKVIGRRIRAFWSPPHQGARIEDGSSRMEIREVSENE